MEFKKQEIIFNNEDSGIQVKYIKSKKRLDFFGWYDKYVGIKGGSIELEQFLNMLDVPTKELKRIIRKRIYKGDV